MTFSKHFVKRLNKALGGGHTITGKHTTDQPDADVTWWSDRGEVKRRIPIPATYDHGAVEGLAAGMKQEYNGRPRADHAEV